MKRSAINTLIRSAQACFLAHDWTLPPKAPWDVTDFGLGHWQQFGLVLVNLAEEPEYCEKLMYARKGMTTPAHCHRKKKEDIICRWGTLAVQVWAGLPHESRDRSFTISVNNEPLEIKSGQVIELAAGSRVTRLAARSTTRSPMRARGSSPSAVTRRPTARILASSSSIPNGLVT